MKQEFVFADGWFYGVHEVEWKDGEEAPLAVSFEGPMPSWASGKYQRTELYMNGQIIRFYAQDTNPENVWKNVMKRYRPEIRNFGYKRA